MKITVYSNSVITYYVCTHKKEVKSQPKAPSLVKDFEKSCGERLQNQKQCAGCERLDAYTSGLLY